MSTQCLPVFVDTPLNMPPTGDLTPAYALIAVRQNVPPMGMLPMNDAKMLDAPSAYISWVPSSVFPLAE
jgi:hypothetical protein